MRYIFYFILGYLLVRFITGFVIPVFRTSKQIRRQFNDIHDQMQEQMRQQQQQNDPETSHTNNSSQIGEYIEFEELKSK
ncbi:MAG: hypothetical protein C5B52_16895 [Bacteroidetes bacterium]|nr:MAG: hypothetical protein C5B52_16895 [Bacteroidota bacterium]